MRSLFLGCTFVVPLILLTLEERWDRRWVDFESRCAFFSVTCPGTPREQRAPLKGPRFGTKGFIWFVTEDERRSYRIGYGDFPTVIRGKDPEVALDALTDDFRLPSASEIGDVRRLSMDDWPGQEMCYRCGSGAWVRQRTWLVGYRFFQVQVVGSRAAIDAEEADRFLDSFHARTY